MGKVHFEESATSRLRLSPQFSAQLGLQELVALTGRLLRLQNHPVFQRHRKTLECFAPELLVHRFSLLERV